MYTVCPHKGLKIYFLTIHCVSPINITTLCSTKSAIRQSAEFITHHSEASLIHPEGSNLTRLCTEIILLVRSGLDLKCFPSSSSSCFPGVWMCVAPPPSCLNRSLLKELARLATNPLIPLQWGKAQKAARRASSQVYLNISRPEGWERNNTAYESESHHQHFHTRTE